jgi:hypothetical protein
LISNRRQPSRFVVFSRSNRWKKGRGDCEWGRGCSGRVRRTVEKRNGCGQFGHVPGEVGKGGDSTRQASDGAPSSVAIFLPVSGFHSSLVLERESRPESGSSNSRSVNAVFYRIHAYVLGGALV